MSAQSLAQSVSTFVIFEIIGGCACCAPGARETVLPAGWAGQAGHDDLRTVLSSPHGVTPGAIKILVQESADGMTRERVTELRERALRWSV